MNTKEENNINSEESSNSSEINKEIEKVVKRVPMLPETYKFLKIMAIDMDLDADGAIKPEMIGHCIDELIKMQKDKNNG